MMKKSRITHICCVFVSVLVVAVIVFPIIWALPAVFKPNVEMFGLPNTFLPQKFTMDNFKKVTEMSLNGSTFLQSVGVTLVVSFVSTFFSLFINMFAAYAFARLEFYGKNFLWALVLSIMFIPGLTTMFTSVRMVNLLHMADTIWALIIPGLAGAYNIFFFRQFFLGIPESLEDACRIDGASRLGIFFRLFLPMSKSPLVIIGISTFMGSWNSYVWPSLVVIRNPKLVQVMQLINSMRGSYYTDYGVILAATVVTLIVPITVVAIFQKGIMEGISLTGLK